jgi:hypothetical protein
MVSTFNFHFACSTPWYCVSRFKGSCDTLTIFIESILLHSLHSTSSSDLCKLLSRPGSYYPRSSPCPYDVIVGKRIVLLLQSKSINGPGVVTSDQLSSIIKRKFHNNSSSNSILAFEDVLSSTKTRLFLSLHFLFGRSLLTK